MFVKEMNMRRLGGGAMLCIVLISALVTGSIEGKRKTLESFLGNGIGWVYPEIDEDMAEKVWMNCKQELRVLLGSVHDADFYLDTMKPKKEMSSELGLLRKRKIQKAINSFSPQVKETLLFVCWRRHDLQNGEYKSWILKYQELFPASRDARRRQLRGEIRVNRPNPPAQDEDHDLSQATSIQTEIPPDDPSPPVVQNPPRSPLPKKPPAENPAKGSAKIKALITEAPDTKDSVTEKSPPRFASPRQKAPPQTVDPPPDEPPAPVDPPPPVNLQPPVNPPPPVDPPPTVNPPPPVDPPPQVDSPPASPPKGPDHPPTLPPRRFRTPPSPPVDPPPPSQSDPPPQSQSDPPPPTQSEPPPPAPSDETQDDTDSKKKTIIIAVGSGIVGALLFAGLVIYCVRHKRDRIGQRNGQKDERPLLNSCLSDFSGGSSPKSRSIGNSSGEGFGITSGKHGLIASHLSGLSNGGEPGVADRPSNTDSGFSSRPPPTPIKPPAPPPPPPPKPASLAPPPPAPRAPAPPALKAPPPPVMKGAPLPIGHNRGASNSSFGDESDSEAPKAKLKPFFWDKVLASPDHSMVWHEIKEGSFQFNEEMMESLFGYSATEKSTNDRRKDSHAFERPQYIQIIDSKKSQNLSILLRALNVTTDEVCDALRQGTELPQELIHTLLKMSPTPDEELKLRLYNGDPSQLGPAERFLKNLVEIPFAFRRLETLLFMCTQKEEVYNIKESLVTLEVACNKLRKNRLFLKLLEAVLKTGNRMNDGTYRGGAQAFKLDTLLKLSDVKGADGKTTLLHFVVQEIIRSEGVRAARTAKESKSSSSIASEDLAQESSQETPEYFRSLGLEVVSGLSTELQDVKRASVIDTDALNSTATKISHALVKAKDFLNNEMTSLEEDSGFHQTLAKFVEQSEAEIPLLVEEEKRIMALVKLTADYFHGNSGKDEGIRLFLIVRDFLLILDKTCKEVKNAGTKHTSAQRKVTSNESSSEDASQKHITDFRQRLFPLISDKSMNGSDTDSDYEI